MSLPFALLLLSPPQPKLTFDQIEGMKHKAYRQLKDYRDVIDMVVVAGEKREMVRLSRRISGSKQRLVLASGPTKLFESGYDGTSAWLISYPVKQYLVAKGPNKEFSAKYVTPPRPKTTEGAFNFLYNNGYDLQFFANPPLKIVSDTKAVLQGQPVRKIVAQAVIKANERYVKVTQWFFPDKWILRQFKVEGKGKESGKFEFAGVVTEANFAAGSTPNLFKLPMKEVKGFKKVDPPK